MHMFCLLFLVFYTFNAGTQHSFNRLLLNSLFVIGLFSVTRVFFIIPSRAEIIIPKVALLKAMYNCSIL